MTGDEPELNDEQQAVAEAPADARLLVVAGAGQGKTEVVVSRIDCLIQDEGLDTDEILVLSFSRAAVSAVRRRLEKRDVATPDVRTFDSFAGRLLLDAGIEAVGSYGARIRRATQLLRETDEPLPSVEPLRHIIIDEIQDLVGDRADFVLAVLDQLEGDAGLTTLGDPLQGVYDFQLEESIAKTSPAKVFHELRTRFDCHTVGLGKNYRARGPMPKQVVALGHNLRTAFDKRDEEAADQLLSGLMDDCLHLGSFDRWYESVRPRTGKTSAVLCTTNADVLRVSRALNQRSVAHAVRRQAQDFGAARWIASTLGGLTDSKAWKSEVEEALAKVLEADEIAPRWMELKAAEGYSRSRETLDIARIRRIVEARALALPLTEPDSSPVIVSTIHRAKGLEFDSVFIVQPAWRPEDEGAWTRICREYVALSRARDFIFICDVPDSKSKISSDRRRFGRLIEQQYRRRGPGMYTTAIEFHYDDVEESFPVSWKSTSAHELQCLLRDSDLVGLPVTGHLDPLTADAAKPSYLLECDGHTIGRTSTTFGAEFEHYFGYLRSRPTVIDGLSVASVETVAGDPLESERAGIGRAGFWLVPRLTGLAVPDRSTT